MPPPAPTKSCVYLPAGDRVLSVIETKFLHLLNMMKLAPYSVDYASLRHPDMCSCSKHNTQFVQQLIYFIEDLCASPMLVCVTVLDFGRDRVWAPLWHRHLFVENVHGGGGGYWQA